MNDIIVKEHPFFTVWQVAEPNLPGFSRFVAGVNCKRSQQPGVSCGAMANEMSDEDIMYCKNSFFYAVKTRKNKIAGTVRVCRWEAGMVFPAERLWGIEIPGLAERMPFISPQIWHLGRLAVDGGEVAVDPHLAAMRVTLFKTLLVAAFRHICTHEHNLMVAECDTRLSDKIKLLGIRLKVLGSPLNYMGSEVVPVCCTGKELQLFIKKYGYVWDL